MTGLSARPHLVPLLLLLALLPVPGRAHAQNRDTATVVAGPHYRAGSLHRRLLGDGYRELWTTPIRVEVLDLRREAGGLTPVSRGGHKQTRALRFRGEDGREYNFRSVDKEVTPALPPFVQQTLADQALQDITSAQHPAAPVVATALLDAVGVLNPGPRLVVLPDHPALGEFRAEFAGMLGSFEVHPDEGDDGEPLFAGSPRVVGTETMLDEVEDDPRHRIDARAFLAARLMDVFLGDFDRHADQWRWTRVDHGGLHWWVPVPEDRDYAFVDYGGALVRLARWTVLPRLVSFRETYPSLRAMMDNSLELNRRLLAGLPREAWDSVAARLQATLTDRVIDDAVRQMPASYRALSGEELSRVLRARRDRLPGMASAYYRLMAENVEIHTTDADERLDVERRADGSVGVAVVATGGAAAGATVYLRDFSPEETRELRIHLHGGDDRAVVRGAGGPIVVRVLGGGGDDHLQDAAHGPTVLYDSRGENRLVPGARTRVDRRPYDPPERADDLLPRAERDWGTSRSLAPWADWRPDAGPVIGGGPTWTRYGFRHRPYAARHRLRAMYAPLHGRFAAEYWGALRAEGSPRWLELLARGSSLEAVRFHGFGNDSPALPIQRARLWQRQLLGEIRWHLPLGGAVDVYAGPVAKYTDLEERQGVAGTGPVGQVGARGGLHLDTRDSRWFPRRGTRLEIDAAAYPPVWDVTGGVGRVEATGSAYASLPVATRPVLALRVGGTRVWGAFPLHEAAFLGGGESLRGVRFARFAGDAALFGNAELRVPVTRAELFFRGDLGLSLLADAGRVYMDGRSPGGWHTAAGGSLWFATPVGSATATYARGEENRFYLQIGLPF